MHIWTETPIKEIWHQLRYLKSPTNVSNLLSGRTKSFREIKWPDSNSERLEKHAFEISSCIEQSDQYFHAAENVGLATKPLLQFYGAQSLAKAVILANDCTINLSDLRYHGLSSRPSIAIPEESQNLRSYSDNTQQWEIESEFAIVNDGVFPHLARITGDKIPKKGHVLRLKELIMIIPDLSKLFERHYGIRSHCFRKLGNLLNKDGFLNIRFEFISKEDILSVFPEFENNYVINTLENKINITSKNMMQEPPDFIAIIESAIAGEYIIRSHNCGINKPLTIQYAVQFILSNIVRYKPAFWMGVLQGTRTGSASIVEAFCNLFERQYPSEILKHIWNEKYTFGSPGYLV